jgi:hypothetical protein
MFLTGDQVWLQHQLSWLCFKLIKHKLLCICDACNLSCLFCGYCILGFVTWLQLRQSQSSKKCGFSAQYEMKSLLCAVQIWHQRLIPLKPIINWSESQSCVICTLNLEQYFILAWQRRPNISMVLLHYMWGFRSRSSQSQCACNSLHWLNLTLKEIVMYVSLLTHCGQMNWTETCNYIFFDTLFLFQLSGTFSTDWRTFSSCSLQMPAHMFDFVRPNWSFHSKHCYTIMQEGRDIMRVSVLQLCTMKSGPLHMLVSLEMHYSR